SARSKRRTRSSHTSRSKGGAITRTLLPSGCASTVPAGFSPKTAFFVWLIRSRRATSAAGVVCSRWISNTSRFVKGPSRCRGAARGAGPRRPLHEHVEVREGAVEVPRHEQRLGDRGTQVGDQ